MLQADTAPRPAGGDDRGGYAGAIERPASNPEPPAEPREPPPVSLRRLLPAGSLVSADDALARLRLEQRVPAGGKRPYVLLNMISTADGRAQLSIYSRPNEAGETPSTYLQNKLRYPRSAIQYQRVTRSFFAISTETDGTIYYSRCNFSANAGGAIHCFDLMYPQTEKKAWDGVVTRISRSLRPL